jgi:integrase
MDSKIKYVRYEKGKPWYRRRYPTTLRGHPQLDGKDHFRKRIKADPQDAEAFIADWNSLNSAYETFVSALFNVNSSVIEEAQLTKKALDYLRLIDVPVGMLGGREVRFDGEVKGWLLDNYFDEMRAHSGEESMSASEILPSELVAIQEEAWRLIHIPKDTPTQYKTYSQIFEAYWVAQNMSESSKRDRETKRLRYEFIDVIGGDCIVTSDVLKDHLVKYASVMRKKEIIFKGSIKTLSESTIKKYINVITQPIIYHNEYVESDAQKIQIKRPKFSKRRQSKNKKPPLDYKAQMKLMSLIEGRGDWKELFCLIAIQTGMHPSEAVQLSRASFNFANTPVVLSISGEGTTRKDDARQRLVPLVLATDRIKELIEAGQLEILLTKSTDNMSAQLVTLLSKVGKGYTAYSLRHTLRHNFISAAIPVDLQAEIGGWVAKGEFSS